ncbi:MAG: DUF262 domain-containing protein [Gaiellaceae bacterium]
MEIRTPEYTVADYCDMYDRKEVRVNRQYQRSDQVWPRAAQSFLIETILLGFPVPKLFLHQKTDLRTRRPIKEIVDGQQRTRAIVDFFNDEYRLTSNVTLAEAVGKRFSQLDEDLQSQFSDYGLQFDLFVGATDEDVREVFRRMNSFTVPLNPEEQRHAEFQGEFKWFMRNVSTDYAEAFRQAGVFGQKALVRMQDQKLLTEIASAYFDGVKTTNKRTLDTVYRTHDKPADFTDDQRTELERRLRGAFDAIFEWRDLYDTPLMRPHQMYSLTLAVMHMDESLATLEAQYPSANGDLADDDIVLVNLTRLAEAMEEGEELAGVLRPFVKASSEKTNVGAQRLARIEWFCRALSDDLPE